MPVTGVPAAQAEAVGDGDGPGVGELPVSPPHAAKAASDTTART
jgi:hypothetical protein